MQQLYFYSYDLYEPGNTFYKSHGSSKTVEILGENADYLVVLDHEFTTIGKTKPVTTCLNAFVLDKPSMTIINDNQKDYPFNSVRYRLYSTKPVLPSTIYQQIKDKLSAVKETAINSAMKVVPRVEAAEVLELAKLPVLKKEMELV